MVSGNHLSGGLKPQPVNKNLMSELEEIQHSISFYKRGARIGGPISAYLEML